jgi:heme/copper-type cytochrome/quinol oxidase subunit 4
MNLLKFSVNLRKGSNSVIGLVLLWRLTLVALAYSVSQSVANRFRITQLVLLNIINKAFYALFGFT